MNFCKFKVGQTYSCYLGDDLHRLFYVLDIIDTNTINGSYVKLLNLVDKEKRVTIRNLFSNEWIEHITRRYMFFGRIDKQE